jgi:hypothetical protein
MALQSSRSTAIFARLMIAALAMVIALTTSLWPGKANASPSARHHHGIPIIMLGKVKHYHHPHGTRPSLPTMNPRHCQ